MKYGVIYADPPWLYDDARTHASAGMARSDYECMPVEKICELPIASLAADNCMLCLWGTMPKLREALAVVDAWGFQYITIGFVWVKLNPSGLGIYSGLGHWTNANAEVVLFGRKGMPRRCRRDVKQIVIAPRGRHSAKPEEVRQRIETLFEGPYLELFARKQSLGWDTWGDGVVPTIDLVTSPSGGMNGR